MKRAEPENETESNGGEEAAKHRRMEADAAEPIQPTDGQNVVSLSRYLDSPRNDSPSTFRRNLVTLRSLPNTREGNQDQENHAGGANRYLSAAFFKNFRNAAKAMMDSSAVKKEPGVETAASHRPNTEENGEGQVSPQK
jgi:hypothetical protein